jgi:hypothetical protein
MSSDTRRQSLSLPQQLVYVPPDGTVTLKGRAACEINSTQVCQSVSVCGGGDSGQREVAISLLLLMHQPLLYAQSK